MRHRGQTDEVQNTDTIQANQPGRLLTLSELMATDAPIHGKHRAPIQHIPTQKLPTHDVEPEAPAAPAPAALVRVPIQTPAPVEAPVVAPIVTPVVEPAPAAARPVLAPKAAPVTPVAPAQIPHDARWKASHYPRLIASTLLVGASLGTAVLGLRYAQNRTSEDLLSLVIGFAVVVVLWALVIVSTPQVVTLSGSILDIRTTGGSEHFDLADGLQPVDLVGNPRTSHWAVLLHRPNGTTLVLRRNDVDALELDPIVRHYRNVATQRFLDREARFNL